MLLSAKTFSVLSKLDVLTEASPRLFLPSSPAEQGAACPTQHLVRNPHASRKLCAALSPAGHRPLQTYVGIIAVLNGVMSLQGPGPRVLAGGGSRRVAQSVVVRHLHRLAGGTPVHTVPHDGLLKIKQDRRTTG